MTESTITCLNGRFVRADRAAVPLADRGFRFGDGVFETIRLHSGMPYQWEAHMARLAQGLAALRIAVDVDWNRAVATLIKKNHAGEGFLRISVSRGVGSRGYLPHPPGMPATWAIEYLPPIDAPDAPYHVWLSGVAKIPPQCLPVRHKLAQGLSSTLAALEAQKHGCDEALQLTIDGRVSETAGANIFWVVGNELHTPSLETGCLAGTTREAIFRLSPVAVRAVSSGLSVLEKAEAVFITNTRLGVHPVASMQPMGWNFNTHHPLLRDLQGRLARDRDAQAKQSVSLWAA